MKAPLKALRIPPSDLDVILRAMKKTKRSFSSLVREGAVKHAKDLLKNAA
jgi:uncharacterized protein (DUF1778 family)